MAFVDFRCGNGIEKAFLSSFIITTDQQQQLRRNCSCRRSSRQLPQAILKSNSQQPQIKPKENHWKLPPMAPVVYENLSFSGEKSNNGTRKGEILMETLDMWMRDSVSEIVKKIEEAPFLVHVFSSKKNGKTKVTHLNREKGTAEEWPFIKRRWEEREERGECSTPDGIILVEELKDENEEEDDERRGDDESRTRSWGIVIQGRGLNCSPACYVLKTCRVGLPSIGFCTHYCLVKAQLHGETALQQMKKSWLLHPQLMDQHSYFF